MIYASEDLTLVEALGKFYPIFLEHGRVDVNTVVEVIDDPKWTRNVVLNRMQRLVEAGYLEKENYRSWQLNVEKILALNARS